jgi:hypothetical protein
MKKKTNEKKHKDFVAFFFWGSFNGNLISWWRCHGYLLLDARFACQFEALGAETRAASGPRIEW